MLYTFQQWKNFKNRLMFDKVKADYTLGATFLLTHPVCIETWFLDLLTSYNYQTQT